MMKIGMRIDNVIMVEMCLDVEHNIWAVVSLSSLSDYKWNAEIFRLNVNGMLVKVGYHDTFPISIYSEEEARNICLMLKHKFQGDEQTPWPIFEKEEEEMEKPKRYIRDGKIAVVYSPGYGGGLGSWNERHMPDIVTDPEIVEFILLHKPKDELISSMAADGKENADMDRLRAFIASKYNDAYLGADILSIGWVSLGERWRIDEYDGAESIEILDIDDYYLA